VTARKDLGELQDGFGEEENHAQEIILEQELHKLARDLSPCIAVRFIRPFECETIALSFHNNLQTVLKEILVGGLSEASNSTKTWRADVEVNIEKGMAAVRISDDFPPLAAESAARINNGDSFSLQNARLREWGLALAQHIALRGGGRLIVTPSEAGNLTTYLIPLA
jgi:hypothetical protein